MLKIHDKCEICGKELKLLQDASDLLSVTCYFCKKTEETEVVCPEGHYICNDCHSKDSIEIIKQFCRSTELIDPYEIANKIMLYPKFKMYGPEHHVLVPASILTSLKNLHVKNLDGKEIKFEHILEAVRRSKKVLGGWCGYYGTCGAGVGSGIAISIFTQANPSKDIPRTLSNLTTSRSLARIGDGLEHCCKRSVLYSISEALKLLNEKFNLELNFIPKPCKFSESNDKCEKDKCPYHS
ncbi:MAG: DUF5714 domain-containing protein [Candidatus Helarchaeota archaeon]